MLNIKNILNTTKYRANLLRYISLLGNSAIIILLWGAGSSTLKAQTNPHAPTETQTATVSVQKPKDSFVYSPLTLSAEETKLCLEINKVVFSRHYAHADVDTKVLAGKTLDTYIGNLDYRRMIFLRGDISTFKHAYAKLMPRALTNCNLKPAYAIFNTYRKKALDRYNKILQDLEAQIARFDYSVDEVWISNRKKMKLPYPQNRAEADDLWRRSLKNQVLGLKLIGKKDPEIVSTIRERLIDERRNLRSLYSSDALALYINSYLQLLDTHTGYFPPTRSEDFNISMRLSLEGIGAMLRQDGEYTKVTDVLAGGPASKQSNLKSGDRIIGVAQGLGEYENVIGWRLDKVIEKIRGPRNSTVRLKVLAPEHNAYEEARDISIVRDKVKLEQQAAKKSVVEVEYEGALRRIGVVTLPSFYLDFNAQRRREADYRSSTRDVSKLLGALEKEGDGIDGLIIDLRNNAGGSLVEANTLTGMFIETGPTVQVRHSDGRIRRHGKLRRSRYYNRPLAVLVNRGSASASEIFGAAIQDHGRGVVIGTTSYGKGTVQSLHTLSKGQVKITDAKFYRISGASTQRRGVIPDVLFPPTYDVELLGEDTLEFALEWDQMTSVRHRHFYDIDSITEQLGKLHAERTLNHPEFEYLRQLAVVRDERKRRRNQGVPLSEEKRKARHEEDKQRKAKLEDIRRAKPVTTTATTSSTGTNTSSKTVVVARETTASTDGDNKTIASTRQPTEPQSERKGESEEDPFLVETALILLDSMRLLNLGDLAVAPSAPHE